MKRGLSREEELLHSEALGLRRRKPVNYAQDNFNDDEEPEPPQKRAAATKPAGRAAAARSSGKATSRRRADSDDESDASAAESDESQDDDASDGGWKAPRRQAATKKKPAKTQRRSTRDRAGSAAKYTVSSDEDDESEDDDDDDDDDDESDGGGRPRGKRAAPAPSAPSVAASEVERLLAERLVTDNDDGAVGAPGQYEYFAKLRGRSYIHCRWVSEEEVLGEHQGAARLKRWHKVRDQQLQEAAFDPEGGGDMEPFPPEWAQVERVVSMRHGDDGVDEYLIKWRLLTYAEASWEMCDDIEDDEKIREFERLRHPPTDPRHAKPPARGRNPQSDWVKANGTE
eukprot:1989570-Prymnesium_polylepis.1